MELALTTIQSSLRNNRDAIRLVALGAVLGIALPASRDFLSWFRLHFVHRSKIAAYQHPHSNDISSPSGSDSDTKSRAWALVTGASDGIGNAYVHELASRGFNVILHGRNQQKVNDLITDLQSQYVDSAFEAFILSATAREEWTSSLETLVASLRSRRVNLTVLINNVGGSVNITKPFESLGDRDPEEVTQHIDMNVTFATQITRALLPLLIANKPSLIINMGSLAGILSLPWLPVYGGSKAYNLHFSRCLRLEMIAENHPEVEVLGIVCGKVATRGNNNPDPSLFTPTARHYAKCVIDKVGCGEAVVGGYWAHDVQVALMGLIPRFVAEQQSIRLSKTARLLHGQSVAATKTE